jgi:hypothetical protein
VAAGAASELFRSSRRAVAPLELVAPTSGRFLHGERPGRIRIGSVLAFGAPEKRHLRAIREGSAGRVGAPGGLLETKLALCRASEVFGAHEGFPEDGQCPRRVEQWTRSSDGGAARCGLRRWLWGPPTSESHSEAEGHTDPPSRSQLA